MPIDTIQKTNMFIIFTLLANTGHQERDEGGLANATSPLVNIKGE